MTKIKEAATPETPTPKSSESAASGATTQAEFGLEFTVTVKAKDEAEALRMLRSKEAKLRKSWGVASVSGRLK